ncbi:MAG: type II CAAX endopeptidase family protein [Rhodothermales bacterium]
MKHIFWNEAEERLRAGWRITLFLLALVGIGMGLLNLLEVILGGRPAPGVKRELAMVGSLAIAATALLPLGRKYLDKRSTVSLGLRFDGTAVKDLVFGWLLSGAMAGSFLLLLMLFGNARVEGVASASVLIAPLLLSFFLYVLVGWWEELFFRGYLFDNLKAGLGLTVAIAVSCVLYGVVHAANPNATILSTVIIVVFGFLRLFGLISTRQLWLSMGMHMGWNFFQGSVFGFAASGQGDFKLLTLALDGPAWLTGGSFGPEGSVLILPILGLSMLVMAWWAKRTRPEEAQGISAVFQQKAEPVAA